MPRLHYYNISENVIAFSTTRHEGESKGSYGDFNINPYCGDDPQAIAANRIALDEELGITDERLLMPHQVHQTKNLATTEDFLLLPPSSRQPLLKGVDSLTTNEKGVCIGVSTADCIPVLLYDEAHHAAAAIHAGWRGTVKRIVMHTLRTMGEEYGTQANDVKAVIGPGISLKNFEIGDEVYEAFASEGFDMTSIAKRYPTPLGSTDTGKTKWHIDLPLCNQLQLESMGVPRKNILQSGICTFANAEDYFSARRLGQASGRIYTGIILR